MNQDEQKAPEATAESKPAPAQPEPLPAPVADGAAKPKETHVALTFTHGQAPLLSARFDPLGKYVFAAGHDRLISRFSFPDGRQTRFPEEHDSWIRGLAITPDGQTLLTGGYDGRLIWWPATADQPQPVRKIDAHDGWVREVAVSPDGRLVASCGNDNRVKLWDAASGQLVWELVAHTRHVYNVAFHPDGTSLVSNDLLGNFKHWELSTGNPLRELRLEQMHKYDNTFKADIGGARGMSFSRDGRLLAACGITEVSNAFAGVGKPTVELVDWQTAKPVKRLVEAGKGVAWGVVLHPDNYVVAAYGDVLLFWTYTENKLHHQAKLGNVVFDLSLHPDGLHLATAHHDGKVRISRMAPKGAEAA